MTRFLTSAWVDELDRAASSLAFRDGPPVAVEHVVDGFTYHVLLGDGRVRFVGGPAPEATVRFTADRATAGAIARGELSAQRAFMDGVLHIDGDPLALERELVTLRDLDDVLAPVRDTTEW